MKLVLLLFAVFILGSFAIEKSPLSILEQQKQHAISLNRKDWQRWELSSQKNQEEKRALFSGGGGGKRGYGYGPWGKMCRCKVGGQLMFLVQFIMNGEGALTSVPEANLDNTPGTPATGTDEALCFTGIMRLPSGENLGIASDCPYADDLIIENTSHTSPSGTKTGQSLQNRNGLSIWNFGGGNVLWARSFNLVTLLLRGSEESDTSREMSHSTAFYPDPTNHPNSDYFLENSSGVFDKATGEVRLAGHIDLRKFDLENATGIIKWDCLFHFFMRHPEGWPRWFIEGVLRQPCDPDPSFFDFSFWNLEN